MGKNKKKQNGNSSNNTNAVPKTNPKNDDTDAGAGKIIVENGTANLQIADGEQQSSTTEASEESGTNGSPPESKEPAVVSKSESASEVDPNSNSNSNSNSESNTDSELAAKLRKAEQERDEVQHSYDNLVSRLSSMKTVFGKMKQSELELEEKTAIVERLTMEKEDLERRNQETIERYETLLATKVDKSALHQLREENAELNNECAKLSDTLTKTRREFTLALEELQDEKYAFENTNSKLTKKVHELNQEINELNIRQGEAELEHKNIKHTIKDYEEKIDAKDREIEEARVSIRELHNVISNNQQEFTNTETRLKKEIEDTNREKEEQNKTIETLRADLKSYEALLEEMDLKTKRVEELQTEVNNKQLLIGKLRHEAIILNEHLTKALTMLKQGGDSSNKSVDRELISNVIISFLQLPRGDSKKFEALQLISGLLEWDPSQKIAAGLQHDSNSNSKNQTNKNNNDGTEAPVRQSFVSLWTEYLEKESSKK
ncbi:uncharacterized protein LODBEIA_P01130 [Lodderomyces beijingensis]|uniref:GRIP domain-containing protein n=1 Tax=Lodderomyces beijingensis TaxID=1775926 RepID=A0ABP0ZCI8_9ASCO